MTPRPRLSSLRPLLQHSFSTTPLASTSKLPLPPLLFSIASSQSTSQSLPTTLNGWIRQIRKQKTISFAVIADGTVKGGTQVVLPKGLEEGLTIGGSASFEGEWVTNPRGKDQQEFKVNKVTWIGESDAESYPIPNTKQGIPLPILRHNAHLRARKDEMAAVLRVRSEMNWAMSDYFRNEVFLKVEAPIITSSDCEGGGEVFKVIDATPPPSANKTSDSPSNSPPPPPPTPSRFLSVSSQLHLEAIASSHPRVYALSPCFRAEKSDTARHLQEFWMLEAEMAFLDESPREALEQVMAVTEGSVRAIARHVRETMGKDEDYLAERAKTLLDLDLKRRTDGLLAYAPYPRLTYSEAVEKLEEVYAKDSSLFVYKPEWGASLQTEHEKYLAEQLIKGPLFVTDYPSSLKPFYMLKNSPSQSGQTTACFDLLVPHLGELAGGSLRTHSHDELLKALEEATPKMKKEDYEWYLDLRKYGTTRHGGFGIGWERLVGLLTGMGNVRECIAFPRAGEGSRF